MKLDNTSNLVTSDLCFSIY